MRHHHPALLTLSKASVETDRSSSLLLEHHRTWGQSSVECGWHCAEMTVFVVFVFFFFFPLTNYFSGLVTKAWAHPDFEHCIVLSPKVSSSFQLELT